MKKVALLVVGLVLFSIPLFAGEYLMNDTGATVYGLRVVFSEPVEITGFGDVLDTVGPAGEATAFTFSGGVLDAWGGHWFNWEPSSALLVNHQWLTDPATVETAAADWAAYEASRPFLERNPNPTYEEIMAEIAVYPGPDEPLYEPVPDEAIWLTDLEGYADIYDNDSIKINYADSFDQSQITKIEVYRNGIKMRFLPDKFDVLTNEQMKTFDGNPLEHTPASNHTDHAIMGYRYRFCVVISDINTHSTVVTTKSPFQVLFNGRINLGNDWQYHMGVSNQALVAELAELRSAGFEGIQIGMEYFMETSHSNELFTQYTSDQTVCPDWRLTPAESDVRRMLRAAEKAGMDVEFRIQVWITNRYRDVDPSANRGGCTPSNIDLWFRNYTEICLTAAHIAEEEGVEILCVGVELSSMQWYVEHWARLVSDVREVFSGKVVFSEQTCGYFYGWNSQSLWDSKESARFWDIFDEIQMNSWVEVLEDTTDACYSVMVANFIQYWYKTVKYYKEAYPRLQVTFGEIGVYSYNGAALGYLGDMPSGEPDPGNRWTVDTQEVSDMWAAQMVGIAVLGVDDATYWCYELAKTVPEYHAYMTLDEMPALNTLISFTEPGACYLAVNEQLDGFPFVEIRDP